MAVDLRLPLVATNDAHYLEAGDHAHHEALLCIGTGKSLDDPNRFRFDGHGFYLKSGDEMAELFHDHPSALAHTLEIAERCNVDLGLDSGRYHLPEFQIPAGTTSEAVVATPTGGRGSNLISTVSRANGLATIPVGTDLAPAGSRVRVMIFRSSED